MGSNALEVAVVAVQSVVAQTNDGLDRAFGEYGLTQATAQALWAIDPAEEPPSMKTMAQRLFCNAPNLTFVTNQLADRGLVERVVDPADRRSRLVRLTEDGLRVRTALIDAALTVSPLSNLSGDALKQLIDTLSEALENTRDP